MSIGSKTTLLFLSVVTELILARGLMKIVSSCFFNSYILFCSHPVQREDVVCQLQLRSRFSSFIEAQVWQKRFEVSHRSLEGVKIAIGGHCHWIFGGSLYIK